MGQHQVEGWLNYELERMWKEAVMPYFKVLSQYASNGTEKNNGNLSQESQPTGQFLYDNLILRK
jgi:hypothetical protein